MDEEAKAVQEIAKATGKGLDAAREAGGFIARFISGPLEEAMGIFEDRLKYLRWERQVRLMQRSEQFLSEVGLSKPTRAVPLKIAVPLLQGASLEENNELQDRWAALLVNAANANSGVDIHRSFIEILGQVSPLEAKILDTLYSLPFEEARHAGFSTDSLPESSRILGENEDPTTQPTEEVALALGNLSRLGCIKIPATWGGGESFASVNPTILGFAFVRACTLKLRTS